MVVSKEGGGDPWFQTLANSSKFFDFVTETCPTFVSSRQPERRRVIVQTHVPIQCSSNSVVFIINNLSVVVVQKQTNSKQPHSLCGVCALISVSV